MIPGHSGFSENTYSTLDRGTDSALAPVFKSRLASGLLIEREYLLVLHTVSRTTGLEVTQYFSTHGRVSKDSDHVPHQAYEARIKVPMNYSMGLSVSSLLSGRASFSAGVITVMIDETVDVHEWIFEGYKFELYMGDKTLDVDEFGLIFEGVMEKASWSTHELKITVKDRSAILDQPLPRATYGGAGGLDGTDDLKGKPKPLCLGHCKNITPVLVDPTGGDYPLYQVNDGPIQSLSVYFGAVPATVYVDYNPLLSDGAFELLGDYNNVGQITCDVEGFVHPTKGYINTTGDFLDYLILDLMGWT